MPLKQAMALSCVKNVVNNLMGTIRVARAGYPVSGHNIVTCYIMRLNDDGTCSVRLTISMTLISILLYHSWGYHIWEFFCSLIYDTTSLL